MNCPFCGEVCIKYSSENLIQYVCKYFYESCTFEITLKLTNYCLNVEYNYFRMCPNVNNYIIYYDKPYEEQEICKIEIIPEENNLEKCIEMFCGFYKNIIFI